MISLDIARLLFEIVIHVDTDLDLPDMLGRVLETINAKLDSSGCAVLAEGSDGSSSRLEEILIHPAGFREHPAYDRFLADITSRRSSASRPAAAPETRPQPIESVYPYCFDLDGFGVLVLFTSRPLDPELILAFRPVCDQIARACRACRNAAALTECRERLRICEDRFTFLADNAPDMLFRMSLPDGRYEYVSPASLRITGYTPDEIMSKPLQVREVIHPDWRDSLERDWQALLQGDMPPVYEYQIIHGRTGEIRWLHQRNALVRDAAGRPVAIEGVVSDITENKRAEEALRESEERYRAVFQQSGEGIILIRGNVVIDCNEATTRILQLPQKDILGKTPADLSPEVQESGDESGRLQEEIIAAAFAGRSRRFNWRCRRGNGEIVELDVNVKAIVWGGEAALLATGRDVTALKKAEKALRESEKKFRSITEQAVDIIFIKDKTGRYTFANKAMQKLLGLPENQIVGKMPEEIYGPEQGRKIREVDNRIFAGETINEIQSFIINGREIFLNAITTQHFVKNGEVASIMGFVRDITEQVLAERALRESENKFRSIAEHASDCIFIKDSTRRYTFVNQAMMDLLDLPEEAILGKTPEELFGSQHEPVIREVDGRVFTGQIVNETHSLVINGREMYFNTIQTPLIIEAGEVTSIMGVVRDITDLQNAQIQMQAYQQQLKALVAALTAAEENERKRIATELHDDVAQLMAFVKMKVDSLNKYCGYDQMHEDLEIIRKYLDESLNRIRSLNNELGVPILYELGLIEALETFMTEEMEKHHRLKTSFQTDGSEAVFEDALKIFVYRAVRELLTNVIKYALAAHVAVTIRKNETYVIITVDDDGVGFQETRTGQGSGFGLFSIRERLQYMGGQMTISSQPNEGSRVTLSIPLKK